VARRADRTSLNQPHLPDCKSRVQLLQGNKPPGTKAIMRNRYLQFFGLVLLTACTSTSSYQGELNKQPGDSHQQLSAQTLVDSHKLGKDFVITGDLGVPLGSIVEINATIIAGSSLGWKDLSSDYLLKVTKVGSNSVSNPPTCQFEIHSWDNVKIAPNVFALSELKNGKRADSLSSSQISELERGYVGKNYRLLVYEEGAFSGVPKDLPEDYMVWQDRPFGFRSRLVVLRILDE
jgi:hypothetical protein